METGKKILIVIVGITCISLSFLVGYFMANNIPNEHISIANAICMMWSSACSGIVLGTIGVKIADYIRFK